MVALQELYPDLPLQWLEFERGGLGVFAISKTDLVKHQDSLEA
jgi:ribosomal protein L3 glutamine methyltransferase